jgi:hypothetical protein
MILVLEDIYPLMKKLKVAMQAIVLIKVINISVKI